MPGKDISSPLLAGLAGEGTQADTERALAALGNPETAAPDASAGYLEWYRALSYDYPFVDYGADDAMEIDNAIMLGYGPAPSAGIEGSGAPQHLRDSVARVVAEVLDHSLRFVADRAGRFTRVRYRTAPSGGARHPTDVGVVMSSQGVLWFDPLQRRFVVGDSKGLPTVSHAGGAALVITSSVVRAMWRYRDIRAFRPVLIDAGHVVRDLEAGFEARSWTTEFVPWAGMAEGPDSLTRAVLGLLLVAPAETSFGIVERSPALVETDEVIASPYVSLVVDAGELTLRSHATRRSTPVSSAAAAAVAYSIPSSRGDRPTTPSAIAQRTGVGTEELDELLKVGALIPRAEGLAQWRESWDWSRHDWFPSLLAHLEARPAVSSQTAITHRQPNASVPDYFGASARRRTRRSFSGRPLSAETIEAVLNRVSQHVGPIIVGILAASESHRPGLFDLVNGRLFLRGPAPNEEDVRSMAIGQPWIGPCPLVVWLVARPDDRSSASRWEAATIDLGRVAQSAALGLDDGVGMFQTPALIDRQLEALLGLKADDGAYMLAFGHDGAAAVRPQGG